MKPYLTLSLALCLCTSCSKKPDSTSTQDNKSEPSHQDKTTTHTTSARAAHLHKRFKQAKEQANQTNLDFDYVQQVTDLLSAIDRPLSEEEAGQVSEILQTVNQHSPRLAEGIVRNIELGNEKYPEHLRHSMLTYIRPPVEQFQLALGAHLSEDYLDDILEKSLTRVEAEDIPLIIERLYDESNRGPEFNSAVLKKLFKSKGIAIDDLNHAASSLMDLKPELVPDATRGFYNRLDKLVDENQMTPAEANIIKSIMQ